MVHCQRHNGPNLWKVYIEKKIALGSEGVGGTLTMTEPDEEEDDRNWVTAQFTAETARVSVEQDPDKVVLALRNVTTDIPVLEGGMLDEHAKWYKFFRRIKVAGELSLVFPLNEKKKREGDMTNAEIRQACIMLKSPPNATVGATLFTASWRVSQTEVRNKISLGFLAAADGR